MAMSGDYFNNRIDKVFDAETKGTPEYTFSIGTVIRINNCLENIDDFARLKNYENMFHELKILIRNLTPFIVTLSLSDGKIIAKNEYTEATNKTKNIETEFQKSMQIDRNKEVIFVASNELVNALFELDEYLRVICLKHRLYMSHIDEETDMPVLAKKPRLAFSGTKSF